MVFFFSFGFDFVIFNPALLFVFLQFLAYEIADELGKEKLEPKGNLRKNGDNTVEKSHCFPPNITKNCLGKLNIRYGNKQTNRQFIVVKKRRAFIEGKTPVGDRR
jgi:hypothetical protein